MTRMTASRPRLKQSRQPASPAASGRAIRASSIRSRSERPGALLGVGADPPPCRFASFVSMEPLPRERPPAGLVQAPDAGEVTAIERRDRLDGVEQPRAGARVAAIEARRRLDRVDVVLED